MRQVGHVWPSFKESSLTFSSCACSGLGVSPNTKSKSIDICTVPKINEIINVIHALSNNLLPLCFKIKIYFKM